MTDNEKILKALACITTELYIQNEILVARNEEYEPGYGYVKEEVKKKLTDHFLSFFGGGGFCPGSVAKFIPVRKHT
ncbi:hypothetical protein R84B8_01811 [Treponema sp. R8-4-B8]